MISKKATTSREWRPCTTRDFSMYWEQGMVHQVSKHPVYRTVFSALLLYDPSVHNTFSAPTTKKNGVWWYITPLKSCYKEQREVQGMKWTQNILFRIFVSSHERILSPVILPEAANREGNNIAQTFGLPWSYRHLVITTRPTIQTLWKWHQKCDENLVRYLWIQLASDVWHLTYAWSHSESLPKGLQWTHSYPGAET